MALYSCRSTPQGWRIVKWSDNLDIEAIYNISVLNLICDCPSRGPFLCKHIHMLNTFTKARAIDGPEFLDFSTDTWHRPVAKSFAQADERR